MINLDYAPAVFASLIILVLVAPALYGMLLVDKYWKKNQQDKGTNDDVFN